MSVKFALALAVRDHVLDLAGGAGDADTVVVLIALAAHCAAHARGTRQRASCVMIRRAICINSGVCDTG